MARTKRNGYWSLLRLGKKLKYEGKFQAIIPKKAKRETRGNQDETLTPPVTVEDSTPYSVRNIAAGPEEWAESATQRYYFVQEANF
jgi:hypothetical protein